ncbi:MAG: hypothetical protein DI626_02750 [Micavibrio aeruginosavorus]|uniref:Uncharacterized protein n=1 Tax=Micavibrio aeruginosavorus TaxID=349221 RepID=A0A2W5C1U7_9BACT|nr:MAG: hypothetical protein DI626_02750 [Micavibrio aeruginosavorus]
MPDPDKQSPNVNVIREKLQRGEPISTEEVAAYNASLQSDKADAMPDKAQAPLITEHKRRSRLWPALLLGGGALAAYMWANGDGEKKPEPVTKPTPSATITTPTTQPAVTTIQDAWKDAPINYILQKNARLNYTADVNSDSRYYAKAGSCVSAFQSRQPKNGSLQIDAYDRNLNGGTRPGYVPSEVLGEGRRASPGEVCEASLVAADKNTPLPGQPVQKLEHKAIPASPEGVFRFAEFYTVYGESNIREKANRGDTPRAKIEHGSCVSQSVARNMRGEFVHVTAMGEQITSGWMLIGSLRPAPAGTTEKSCKARFEWNSPRP